MRKLLCVFAALSMLLFSTTSVKAAFIVEAISGGLANANYAFTGDGTAASVSGFGNSTAIGLTVAGSIFGGDGTEVDSFDEYTFSYTPSTDADNFTPAAGTVLGSTDGSPGQGNLSSGLAGGGSGLYRVYITVPASTNVNVLGSMYTLTQNGSDVVVPFVDLNSGGTGPDTQINPTLPPDPPARFVGGANEAWYLLGTVDLLADGSTYNIIQRANAVPPDFVSQRAQAVMWEAVPEPTSVVLLGFGLFGLILTRRNR